MNTAVKLPISLIRGGTFYWVQEKARLIRPRAWDLQRRLPLAVAVAWVPLLILTAAHGFVVEGDDDVAWLEPGPLGGTVLENGAHQGAVPALDAVLGACLFASEEPACFALSVLGRQRADRHQPSNALAGTSA